MRETVGCAMPLLPCSCWIEALILPGYFEGLDMGIWRPVTAGFVVLSFYGWQAAGRKGR